MSTVRLMLLAGAVALLPSAAALTGALPGSSFAQTASAHAAIPPPVVVRELRFLGFGTDVVGPDRASPNGERDAHLSLVVAAPGGPVSLSGLSLWICASTSCDVPFASTPPAPFINSGVHRPTPIAVFRAGKRLQLDARRKSSWLALPRSAKGVKLDFYVNDGPGCSPMPNTPKPFSCRSWSADHRFAPGLHYRVTITSSGAGHAKTASTPSSWLTLPGAKQKPRQGLTLGSFRYLGLDRDVAGPTAGSPPDGQPDAHFSFELTPTGPAYIWGASLNGGGFWTTTGKTAALTVFLDGSKLNFPDLGGPDGAGWESWVDLRWMAKPMQLDLYAYDNPTVPTPWFTPGTRLTFRLGTLVPLWTSPTADGGTAFTVTLP